MNNVSNIDKAAFLMAKTKVLEDLYEEKEKILSKKLDKFIKKMKYARIKYEDAHQKYFREKDIIYKEMRKAQSPIFTEYRKVLNKIG